MPANSKQNVPKAMQSTYDAIVELTDAVCKAHLNEEYAELARKLTAALARKRPSPLSRGQHKTWACGIVYALGSVNFLSDPSQNPHLTVHQLCDLFGVPQVSGYNKSKAIRDLMKIRPFEHTWCLPSRIDQSPVVWMLSVNGWIMDIRDAPLEAQIEALRRGLIPYVPALRDAMEAQATNEAEEE